MSKRVKGQPQCCSRYSRAAAGDNRLVDIDAACRKNFGEAVGWKERPVCDDCGRRDVVGTRNMSGPYARARLRGFAAEAVGGPCIDNLRAAAGECGLNVGQGGHDVTGLASRKGFWRSLRRAGFDWPAFRFPFRKTAFENEHILRTEQPECPPDARRGEHSDTVVNDDRVGVADT